MYLFFVWQLISDPLNNDNTCNLFKAAMTEKSMQPAHVTELTEYYEKD